MDIFDLGRNRYKVNLHTHSTTSDGKFTPEEVVRLYKRKGYDAIALTDHQKTNAAAKLSSKDFTVISGIELHPKWLKVDKWHDGANHHIVALNVPESFEDIPDLPCKTCTDRVVSSGGLCILAHPYWTGENIQDILSMKNLSCIEVFNSDTRFIGKQFNMVHWDGLLDSGWRIPAIAVDDMHSARDLFLGWTVICAKDKSPDSLMKALKSGCSYSSMGPEFHSFDVDFKRRRIKAEFSPSVEVMLLSSKSIGLCLNTPGMKAKVEGGRLSGHAKAEPTSSFDVEIPDYMKYVRCQIMDKKGRYAWTNPVYFTP